MKKEHTQVVFVWAVVFLLLAIMLSALIAVDPPDENDLPEDENDLTVGEYNDEVRSFSSDQELKEFIDDSREEYNDRGLDVSGLSVTGAETLTATGDAFSTSHSVGSTEYSETNIQVEGVDEPDIVKTDGRYLYVLTGYEVVILKAYPGINAQVVSRIELDYYGHGLFVSGSKLVVLSSFYNRHYSPVYSYQYFYGTSLLVYDISSRWSPNLVQNVTVEGYYLDARMIDNHVYMVTSTYMWYWYYDDGIYLPMILYNGVERQIYASDIYYWSGSAYWYAFTTIISVNLQDKTVNHKIYLTDANHEMYVSKDYVYLAKLHYVAMTTLEWPRRTTWFPNTVIHKIAIDDGRISYHASGIVPGFVLNQFSMDEHNGYFRIATTTWGWWTGEEVKNNVYVLNKNMDTVGRLEGLAPGETIYAARFLGNRCYLVTFKRIDPFFVIDLSNPRNPQVLGALKIPGFSRYLHPYDENHVIGVGMNADDQGNFAWFEGMKMSLFDVTNVYRPKEVAKIDIGDRGTYSEALYDHKAFLFDRSKDLLVVPIQLREVDESKFPGEIPNRAYGEFKMQGAFVFSLNTEDGFELRGTISHDTYDPANPYGYSWNSRVRRSLYIEDNIYTVSNEMVKINDMDTLDLVKAVEL
jgi:uncharacterized secreted protein with C-terminal beta-propeller domain